MISEIFWAGLEALLDYLSLHVLSCLIPAFFIAGGISAMINKEMVLKYFHPDVSPFKSYTIAAISGTIIAVCSCTILPLFAGIYVNGAGIGPAVTFLYSGPAISLLAIVYTARLLGLEFGLARAIAAIGFSVVIGFIMHLIFERKADRRTSMVQQSAGGSDKDDKRLILFFASLVGILIVGSIHVGFATRMVMLAILLVLLGYSLSKFEEWEIKAWLNETWFLARQIIPWLLFGIFLAGVFRALISPEYVAGYVGDNSIKSNFIASFIGALVYFATLTEVPIVTTLLELGMAKGPALAMLLAGPSLSIPNMLVLRRIMGIKKTAVYVMLVVLFSTFAGQIYGFLA